MIAGHENVQKLARVFAEVLGRPGYNMYAPAAAILACVERGNDNQKLEVGCMLENIFLRATDMGIGSCWINQARDICDDARVRPVLRAFGVPDTPCAGASPSSAMRLQRRVRRCTKKARITSIIESI